MCLQCRSPWFDSWVGKIPWRRDRLPTPVFLGFPCGSAGKESTFNLGDLGSIPGLERFPVEGKGYPLQYHGLENSRVRFNWVTFTFTFWYWKQSSTMCPWPSDPLTATHNIFCLPFACEKLQLWKNKFNQRGEKYWNKGKQSKETK